MLHELDRTFEDLERGAIDRRTALARVVAVVGTVVAGSGAGALASERDAPSAPAPSSDAPTFRARGLNHMALSVTDVDRARRFYEKHLGMTTTSQGESNAFLDCGGGHFLALFRSETAGMHHYCYTVDDYDAGEVVERLRAAGLEPSRRENRVYFPDADGLTVQLAAKRG